MLSDIANKILLLAGLFGEDVPPKFAGLRKIILLQLALEAGHAPIPALVGGRRGGRVLGRRPEMLEAGRVVGRGTPAAAAAAAASRRPLEVVGGAVTAQGVEAVLGPVDGQLDEVCAEAVALGVLVGEGPELKDCANVGRCQSFVDGFWYI